MAVLAAALFLQEGLGTPPMQDRVFRPLAWAVGGLLLASFLFTAYAFSLRLRSTGRERRRAGLEASWRTAILDVLSGGTQAALLSRIEASDRLMFAEFLLDFERRLKGPERELVHGMAQPVLLAVLPLLEHRDPYRRARAVQILGALGLPAYAGPVVRALADDSDLVAMLAARSLARHGNVEHVPEVTQCITRFETWSSGYLASLLVTFGPAAAGELRSLLHEAATPARQRTVVALALSDLNDLASADLAFQLLTVEKDPELVGALLGLLRELGRPEHVSAARALTSSETASVRMAAFRTLGVLGEEGEDVEVLMRGLDDPSPWVATHAARSLRQLGHSERLSALLGTEHPRALLAGQVLQEAE